MKHFLVAAAITAITVASFTMSAETQPADTFDRFFTGRTMRVDYFHTGGLGQEIYSLDRVVSDGPWPGSRRRLVDDTNLGPYLFEVRDAKGGQLLYSRGFASIFGEWQTTSEEKKAHRTFHESLRFPWPKAPVTVVVKKRDAKNAFVEAWSETVDPASRFVNAADLASPLAVWTLIENGPPAEKVDLLLVGDGYTAAQAGKFRSDAERLVKVLFETEPYKSRKADFNVRAIAPPAATSGINRPRTGDYRRTALSTEYNIFDSERYVLTLDNRSLRDIASAAPYDAIEIVVNEEQYGGGGIFNDQATASVDTAFAEYIFIHEFGHHFAALGDEYYTSDVAYQTGIEERPEPWEPNITALKDPASLKWRDLVEPSTPIPTPWSKEEFEARSREWQERRAEIRAKNLPESEMNALFREQQEWETKFLSSMTYSGKVGAFEGASYEPKGLFRPEADCIMFTRDAVGFCRVCRRAIERIIDMHTR
ncbi:MAG: IgA Peptidase M64 [Vicinamibacterales bacterium]